MRLGILIKDSEYRDALVRKLSSYDNDIFVNVLDGSAKDSDGCLILTDIQPAKVEKKVLDAVKDRTVFITISNDEVPDGCNCVFKYCSIATMVSELSLIYNKWHGSGPGRDHSVRLISVCCETDAYASDRCRSLARQIIYRYGGSVLIIPLSYINDYTVADADGKGILARLMYSLRTGRYGGSRGFTVTDSYGVSIIMLPPGQNPIAHFDEDELRTLISGLSSCFDTIICDAGTCFRRENLSLMEDSDSIVCFESGRRKIGLDEVLDGETGSRLLSVRFTGGPEDAASLDDCVNRIYGTGEYGYFKSKDDKEIRK